MVVQLIACAEFEKFSNVACEMQKNFKTQVTIRNGHVRFLMAQVEQMKNGKSKRGPIRISMLISKISFG